MYLNWTRIGVLALTMAAVSAGATSVLYRDVPALAREADAVVRGKVLRAESRWTGDKRRIVTDVEVSVEERLKGAAAKKTVVIRQPGGVVGDIGQRVDGLASFKVGEEVVVFLERRPDDSFVVSGAAQGKYRIERSSDGRGVFAVPDPNVTDANVVDPITRESMVVRPKTWALEDLRKEIRAALVVQGSGDTSGGPVAPVQKPSSPSVTPNGTRAP